MSLRYKDQVAFEVSEMTKTILCKPFQFWFKNFLLGVFVCFQFHCAFRASGDLSIYESYFQMQRTSKDQIQVKLLQGFESIDLF